jgi:hypothetical protein
MLSASTEAVVNKPFDITLYAIGSNTAKGKTVQAVVTSAPPPAPAALTVGPKPVTLNAGGATQVFTAALQNSSETITWALTGPGNLSSTTGASVTYTSPASTTTISTTLKASVPSGASDTAQITINGSGTPPPPPPVTLTVSPKPATVNAGGTTQAFTATLQNSNETITWSISGQGSLSSTTGATTTFTSPASQTNLTTTLTASVPSGASDTVQITITGSGPPPTPTLTIDPNVLTIDSDGVTQLFTATLQNSSETITWTLTGLGTLSGTTGTSTTYTSPSTTTNKTATLTASTPSGLSASVKISIIGLNVNPCGPNRATTVGPQRLPICP